MQRVLILVAISLCAEGRLPSTPPAVIWGADLSPPAGKSIFSTVESSELAELLGPLLETHMIIAYMEQELTSKDLSCTEPDCFAYLSRVSPRLYLSKVQEPENVLQQLITERNQKMHSTERHELGQLPCQVATIYVHNFMDSNFKEHDQFMASVAMNLTNCSLLQLYTATREKVDAVVQRVDHMDQLEQWQKPTARGKKLPAGNQTVGTSASGKGDPSKKSVVLRHRRGILALEKVVYAVENKVGQDVYYNRQHLYPNAHTKLSLQLANYESIKSGVTLTITTKMGPIQLSMLHVLGNWLISSLLFRSTTFVPRDLLFYSAKCSFCCPALTAYAVDGSRLTIYSLNLDIIMTETTSALDPDYHPKPCWLCEKYLTPGLTHAIFTIVILIGLFGVGMSVLLDMGRNMRVANATDPDPFVKAPADR